MAHPTRRRLGKGLSEMFAQPVSVEPASPPEGDHPASALPSNGAPNTSADPAPHPPTEPSGRDTADASGADSAAAAPRPDVARLPVASIRPNPYQPRQQAADAGIDALAESIRTHGLMQPVVVRPVRDADGRPDEAGGYELIAGERRWRAAQRAELERVPAVIRDLDDRDAAEWALVENLQREDLNPIDRASAFARLIEHFALSHDQVAERVGVDRSTVANLIRLLSLAPPVQALVRDGRLSMGQARAIVGLSDLEAQQAVADRAVKQGLSVRRVEKLVRSISLGESDDEAASPAPASESRPKHHLGDLERRIGEQLGTRVAIRPGRKKGTGKLTIEFYSLDAFDDLLHRLGVDAS